MANPSSGDQGHRLTAAVNYRIPSRTSSERHTAQISAIPSIPESDSNLKPDREQTGEADPKCSSGPSNATTQTMQTTKGLFRGAQLTLGLRLWDPQGPRQRQACSRRDA